MFDHHLVKVKARVCVYWLKRVGDVRKKGVKVSEFQKREVREA